MTFKEIETPEQLMKYLDQNFKYGVIDKKGNKYYNSNKGAEAYIIDLGYLTNQDDFKAITENQDAYAEAIANTIIEELKY